MSRPTSEGQRRWDGLERENTRGKTNVVWTCTGGKMIMGILVEGC